MRICRMGNTQTTEHVPPSNSQSLTQNTDAVSCESFEKRWNIFIQSLDVTPEHIKQIEQLDDSKKYELLQNFVCFLFIFLLVL